MSRTATCLLASAVLFGTFGIASAADTQAPAAKAAPQSMSADEMAATSGGANTVTNLAISDQDLEAINKDNSVNTGGGDYRSGDVTFSPGALVGFNGIGNVTVNTGANANVMGSISVTIATTPTP
ncbi:MAG: hypothetical protein Q8M88_14845 [Phenylobacterium sp.]|uniref:hypothetical protein n=1 Tax=Phenylobacterium sp. TaxID=1871053 RepID=UPI002736ED7B|nr:hypothetical protein [Phenylobacterium sp.]MDP3175708.1 hypothetical protein [Phenylobacterium sp.]